ncbi:MAG: SDR family oxidoreductase [Actinobacteria bacterium]|nr:SDR family oxidoreductase [Actinomycetota bacterium]
MDLKGKVAVVTGASMGIGKSISIALAQKGASVMLAARNIEKLKQAKEEIASSGGSSIIIPADLTDESQIIALFKKVRDEFGRLDILINNAGVTVTGKFVDFNLKDFDSIINVNLKAVYLCCREALKIMLPLKSGAIINISSNIVYKGYPYQAVYCASKSGVLGLTRSIANEYHSEGILVTAIHPGAVDTGMATQARPDIESSLLLLPKDVADTVLYILGLSERAWVDEIVIRRRAAKPF